MKCVTLMFVANPDGFRNSISTFLETSLDSIVRILTNIKREKYTHCCDAPPHFELILVWSSVRYWLPHVGLPSYTVWLFMLSG